MRNEVEMKERLAFSQLWVEEGPYLKKVAQNVPDNSTIVEIGTAQGGSAYIFAHATCGRGVAIHSFDISPSKEAYENLRGLDVQIHPCASVEGAGQWPTTCGNQVDLLFIDGSHTFLDVYRDFQSWMPYMRQGSLILFHDFDPLERGGVVHLGVRLFCETLLNSGKVIKEDHIGRILAVRFPDDDYEISADEVFWKTWMAWGEKIKRILAMEEAVIVGDATSPGVRYVAQLLGISPQNIVKSVDEASKLGDNLLLFERPVSPSGRRLLEQGVASIELIDDWTLNYLVLEGIQNVRDILIECVGDRAVLFKFEELIQMLDHSAHGTSSREEIFAPKGGGVEELSALCAREIVRLHYLENIAKSLG